MRVVPVNEIKKVIVYIKNNFANRTFSSEQVIYILDRLCDECSQEQN